MTKDLDHDKRPTYQTLSRLKEAQIAIREEYFAENNNTPWIIGFSGGKDSTLVAQLVIELLLDIAPSDRKRHVYILCNDTLVESPILASYIDRILERVRDATESYGLPVSVVKTTPKIDQTFFVNLIGKGYPAPTRIFRWCTDRMKIAPTADFIKKEIAKNGKVILLLGVRRLESAQRAVSVNRHKNTEGRLNPHDDMQGCMVFRPIVELTTDDVWLILMQRTPPWGGTHRELITLYRNAQGGECPLIIDKSQAPSCGSSSSRFGCWTCTVVEKDKSMEGFIESGFEHLEPLLDFRDWLAVFRNIREKRMVTRRNGRITLMGDGVTPTLGPFTIEARKEILENLLKTQEKIGVPLISKEEISQIEIYWSEDIVKNAKKLIKSSAEFLTEE